MTHSCLKRVCISHFGSINCFVESLTWCIFLYITILFYFSDFPAQAKLSLNNKKVDSGSPDLIQPTPEDKEKKKGFTKKKKERKSEKGQQLFHAFSFWFLLQFFFL